MGFWLSLADAAHSITSNVMRSLLTMLGIIIGVAALITMLSLGAGAQMRISQQIATLGANVLMVLPGAARGATGPDGGFVRPARLTVDDADAIAAGVPQIARAAPSVQTSARLIHGNRSRQARINGTTSAYFIIRDWPLASGRTFSSREEQSAGKVVVIGQSLKTRLFEDARSPGSFHPHRRHPDDRDRCACRKGSVRRRPRSGRDCLCALHRRQTAARRCRRRGKGR